MIRAFDKAPMGLAAAVSALILLQGCEPVPTGNIGGIVALAQSAISSDCGKAAADEFGLPPSKVAVTEVHGVGSAFHAAGYYPADGQPQLKFECRYRQDGSFQGVHRL